MSEKPKKTPCLFLKEEEQCRHLLTWYRELHGLNQHDKPSETMPPKRGVRAELKRCHKVDEVMMQRGFFDLSRRLAETELDKYRLEGLAMVAVVLAIVTKPTQLHLPAILGHAKDETDKPLLSELRFQRLLASDSPDALLQNLRRAIMQADRQANPLRLADSILHWEAERRNPDRYTGQHRWQYTWAKDYYSEVFKYQKAA